MYISNNYFLQNTPNYESGRWGAQNNNEVGRTVDNYSALAANFPLNPLLQQYQQPQTDQPQISAIGRINSSLASLQAAIEALYAGGTTTTQQTSTGGGNSGTVTANSTGSNGVSTQQTITSSSPSIVTASSNGSATVGTHTISVTQLATPQQLNSTDYQLTDNTFGGTLRFQLGSAAATTVTIAPNSSLSSMVDAINNAKTGVTASLNYDGIDNHLTLSSTSGGTFSVTGVDSAGSTHLAGLNYSSTGTMGTGWLSITRGQDAQLSIDGKAVTASSNTVTNSLLPGVTLNLLGTTLNNPVTINILAAQTSTGTGTSSGTDTGTGTSSGTNPGISLGGTGNIYNININNFYGLTADNLSKHYGDDEGGKAINDIVAGFVQAYNNSVNAIYGSIQTNSSAKIGGENSKVVGTIVSNLANPVSSSAKATNTTPNNTSSANNDSQNHQAVNNIAPSAVNTNTNSSATAKDAASSTPSAVTGNNVANSVVPTAQETARQIIQSIIGAPASQTASVAASNAKPNGSFSSMADLGVSVNADGKMTLDTAKLNSTLKNNPDTFIAALTDFSKTLNAAQQSQNNHSGNSSNSQSQQNNQNNNTNQQIDTKNAISIATQQVQLTSTANTLDSILTKTQQTSDYLTAQLSTINSPAVTVQNTGTPNPVNSTVTLSTPSAGTPSTINNTTSAVSTPNAGTPSSTKNTTTVSSHSAVNANSNSKSNGNGITTQQFSTGNNSSAIAANSKTNGTQGTNAASFLG